MGIINNRRRAEFLAGRFVFQRRERNDRGLESNCFSFRVLEQLDEDNTNQGKMIPRNHCAETPGDYPLFSHCAGSSRPRRPVNEKPVSGAADLDYTRRFADDSLG